MKLMEVSLQSKKSLLAESCAGLTNKQKLIVEGVYNTLSPLVKLSEAEMTADQIKQLFGAVEKGAIDAGNNRTLAGKAVDIPGKVNKVINDVGQWLQNTTPVKGADQKFEQLKSAIGQKFPDLDKNLTAMGTWMKENPGKSAAIIGVMTAIASLAGGPAGGAIAGQILRGTAGLLKGEKLSTAVGQGIKTAAFGFIAGKAFEMLGNWLSGMRADIVMQDKFATVDWNASKTISSPGLEWTQRIRGVNITVLPDDAETIKFLNDQIAQGGARGVQAFDKLYDLAKEIRSPGYKQMLADIGANAKNNDSLLNFIQGAKEGLQAASQGAIAAASSTGEQPSPAQQPTPQTQSVIRTGNAINEFVDRSATIRSWALNESLGRSRGGVHLNEHGIDTLFNLAVSEGPLDALKAGAAAVGGAVKKGAQAVGGAVKKGAQAVGAKASQVGKNLTNKVTNDKLNTAWVKAGSPTDSEKIAQVLRSAGISDEIIKSSYASMKLPAPNLPARPAQATGGVANKAAAAAIAGTMAATPSAVPASTAPAAQANPPAVSSPAAGSQPAPANKGGFWAGVRQGITGKEPANVPQGDTAPATGATPGTNQTTGATSTAPDAAPGTDQAATSAEPEKAMSPNDYAEKMLADFEKYASAGGSIGAPAMKRALKSMWMQSGGIRAESRRNKKKPV